jgi:AcrR family transcriptional regulator
MLWTDPLSSDVHTAHFDAAVLQEGLTKLMATATRSARLGGKDLDDHRHAVALVNGPDEALDLLTPFVLEGIEQGDRVVHIVDPQLHATHVQRLRAAGPDVTAALDSGQLEVRTWNEAYLLGGRFDRAVQLAYMRGILDEGPGLGYPVTRITGSTEWAIETETVRDLLFYEARLDELLRRRLDIVVCTYDLNHHSARTIADVLGIHSVAFVGGVLRTGGGPARGSARERILSAAADLFPQAGIQATGVDALIAAAAVAKATFYRHFPSKDDLVVAWLRDSRTRWIERVRAQVEEGDPDPDQRILRFFDAVGDWLEEGDYRGCPYLNSGVEITDPAHAAGAVIRDFLQEVEDYVESLLAAAGYRESRSLAARLQTLIAGAISLAVARRSGASMLTARDAAVALLSGAKRARTTARISP